MPQDHGATGDCAPAEAADLITAEPVGGRALVDRVGEIGGEPADLDVADEQGEALVLLVVDGPGVVRIVVRVACCADVGGIEHLQRLTVGGCGGSSMPVSNSGLNEASFTVAAPFVVLPDAASRPRSPAPRALHVAGVGRAAVARRAAPPPIEVVHTRGCRRGSRARRSGRHWKSTHR